MELRFAIAALNRNVVIKQCSCPSSLISKEH